jgi:hypothetical protein
MAPKEVRPPPAAPGDNGMKGTGKGNPNGKDNANKGKGKANGKDKGKGKGNPNGKDNAKGKGMANGKDKGKGKGKDKGQETTVILTLVYNGESFTARVSASSRVGWLIGRCLANFGDIRFRLSFRGVVLRDGMDLGSYAGLLDGPGVIEVDEYEEEEERSSSSSSSGPMGLA